MVLRDGYWLVTALDGSDFCKELIAVLKIWMQVIWKLGEILRNSVLESNIARLPEPFQKSQNSRISGHAHFPEHLLWVSIVWADSQWRWKSEKGSVQLNPRFGFINNFACMSKHCQDTIWVFAIVIWRKRWVKCQTDNQILRFSWTISSGHSRSHC